MKIKLNSSLEKVFLDGNLNFDEYKKGSMLKNERFHFGFSLYNDTAATVSRCRIVISSDIVKHLSLYRVDNIPAVMINNIGREDKYVLAKDSGLFPDCLVATDGNNQFIPPYKNIGYFIEIGSREMIKSGTYPIEITVYGRDETILCRDIFTIEVLDACLAKNDLLVTQWIHYDCIARVHGCKVFSDQFYEVCREYFRMAARYGQTMILTPLFTFALDTEEGGERDTFQLIKIEKKGEHYLFSFDALDRFISEAISSGLKYIEFSHLFTQWGAKYAPKIIAIENGKETKIFGWETDASGKEYQKFLKQLLPALTKFTEERGIKDRCFLHISDEPLEETIQHYHELRELIRSYTDIPVMDALSHFDYCQKGGVDLPAVATDCVKEFIVAHKAFLAYYCNAQCEKNLSNRFFSMPSQRNRIIGFQLYETGAKGFLHWGFNFYNSALSIFPIDPYKVSDAGGFFPAGDSYIVYPTENSCAPSLRLFVFYDGIQDYLALKALEQKRGKQFVQELLASEGVEGFEQYPCSASWHLKFREKINFLLKS